MTKILLVDDEAGIRQLLRMTLEMDGYEVLEAKDGPEALHIFEKQLPEIALVDVKLPGMSGIEVLDRIRKINPDVEVIVITGHGDMEMAIECLRREASNFLVKPVSDELISLSIERALEKLNLKKKLRQYTYNLETLVREANIELERAYTFRENIIENSPDALVCIRKGGEIILFNSAAEKLLGHSKRDVVGKMNIVNLYPLGVARQIMKDLRSNDFGGKGFLQKREIQILHKSGKTIPVYISAALLYEGGQETGSVGIFTDLTEKKRMEKQLLRSEKLSSLGKLAESIAHEMKEPLGQILESANLLRNKFQDDAETCEKLSTIVRQTNIAKGIVQTVLDFSHETPPIKSPQMVPDIVQKAMRGLDLQNRYPEINLRTKFDPNVAEINVDKSQLLKVITNLMINSIERMDGVGNLNIDVRSSDDFVEIQFEDFGPAISEETIENVFDPFFTVRQSHQELILGLGLAISYAIVKNHGGDICVKPKSASGATFTVKLPREHV
ncbi:MAG: response regulator [Desulfomonilaceae bacterium]